LKDDVTHSRTDLLNLYLSIKDEMGQPLSRKALRDAVLSLIVAGRDTTAQELSWTYFHLVKNPLLLIPIRKECDELSVVDFDSYRGLHHTLATFHESLRLHPSVSKAAKSAVLADILPNGTIVQPNDIIRNSDWAMGRDVSVWGEDASEFKPSRWINKKSKDSEEDSELIKVSQFKVHAFNGTLYFFSIRNKTLIPCSRQ
jgi:cytochrome P450